MTLDDVVALETEVWQALVDGDAEADARLLSHDFIGVYPTGFGDRAAHVAQLRHGPTVATFRLGDARMLELSPDAVMLSYLAEFRRPSHLDAPEAESMYVSSLWCRHHDRWINVFSQDTPTSEIAVP